ncbi:NADP-dependent oxidoreductase [Lactiplantibacillus garii]|uniref:NADP-dependent oxidoreductase n=1 Tax=Lactiplantibacillus garii TaxID=2306423 RepID=A0A426D6B2_9LACO|nr:NADP-dependent oxidoreductase [Lactiplantibacillus garii]RRK10152.1 NADP-dependent oxidoreductase [Lactiplantibacillus garii]
MLAYGYRKFGGPAVFEKMTQPVLEPTGNQIIIETLAVNLNDEDRSERLGAKAGLDLPVIPGHDVVGKILKVGPAVTGFKVGTIVAAHTQHTYAEQVSLDSDLAVTVPADLTPTQAASLITPGIIAYKTVRYFADVQKDQTVIVKGAGSTVGMLTIQLAQRLGAQVIAIANSRFTDKLTALGVEQIVAYDRQNPVHVLADRGDVIINVTSDGVGGKDDLAMAKFDATIASFAPSLPATSKSIRFRSIHPTNVISDQATLQMLFKLLRTGQLTVDIAQQLPFTLDGFIQGHTLLDAPHNGQLVVAK